MIHRKRPWPILRKGSAYGMKKMRTQWFFNENENGKSFPYPSKLYRESHLGLILKKGNEREICNLSSTKNMVSSNNGKTNNWKKRETHKLHICPICVIGHMFAGFSRLWTYSSHMWAITGVYSVVYVKPRSREPAKMIWRVQVIAEVNIAIYRRLENTLVVWVYSRTTLASGS